MPPLPAIPVPLQTTFLALLGVWAGAYLSGLVLGRTSEDRLRRLPQWAKLVMIGMTLAIGLILCLGIAQGTGAARYGMWIILGLVFGALGDLALAEALPIKEPVLAGIGLFAVGHIFYLLAIFEMRSQLVAGGFTSVMVILIPSLFAGALLWEFLVHSARSSRMLNRASFLYGLLLMVVTAFAVVFTIQTRTMYALGAGMVLFAISDMILAQALVKKQGFPHLHDVVWIIYSTAQILLGFSIIEATGLLG